MLLVERNVSPAYDETSLRRLSIVNAQLGAYVAQCRRGEEERARAAHEESERVRVLGFLKGAPAIINYLRGPDLILEIVHPKTRLLLGDRVREGVSLLDAIPEFRDQPFPKRLQHVFATGEPFHQRDEPVRLVIDGESVETFWTSTYLPVRDASGRIDGVMTFDLDVTDTVRAGIERDALLARADAANRAKDEFMAVLSHELRNPLSPILTALHLLNLRGIEGGERERAIIERQVHHLVRLIDDLLDISRITGGKVALKKELVETAEVIARAVEATSPLFEQKHHHLTIEAPRSGLLVNADPTRLAQVISNLLMNAAKYTDPSGRIMVVADSDRDDVVIRVIDSGVGMAPELLPKVFDMFVQEPQALDRAQGGLGLGLAIVRSIVTLHGGTVHADSKGLGKGSTFTVRLPIARRETKAPSAERTQSGNAQTKPSALGVRVLVVDDNSDSADMIAVYLEALGYEVRTAYDAASALELVETFHPAVALLDIGLPLMDGYELARRLRQQPQLRGLHLIAVSGYGHEDDRARTREAGFDLHLVKPVELKTLTQSIEDLTRAV